MTFSSIIIMNTVFNVNCEITWNKKSHHKATLFKWTAKKKKKNLNEQREQVIKSLK